MKNSIVILFFCFSTLLFSQEKNQKQLEREAREDLRQGNEFYNELNFEEAEIAYKKALSKNPNYSKAAYNLGNAVYQQNRNKEAVGQFELVEKVVTDKTSRAETFHNMGNAFMNEKQYQKAVDAYKNALRNNSKDDETRYNLALAQELLKQEQQQNQNNQDKENQDQNKDNQDNKDDNQKDKEGGDEEKKDDKSDQKDKGEDKEDDKGDEKKNDENQNKQPRPNQLTPEQMKQLLEALNNEENKTQKKQNAQKTQGKKIKQEKDW